MPGTGGRRGARPVWGGRRGASTSAGRGDCEHGCRAQCDSTHAVPCDNEHREVSEEVQQHLAPPVPSLPSGHGNRLMTGWRHSRCSSDIDLSPAALQACTRRAPAVRHPPLRVPSSHADAGTAPACAQAHHHCLPIVILALDPEGDVDRVSPASSHGGGGWPEAPPRPRPHAQRPAATGCGVSQHPAVFMVRRSSLCGSPRAVPGA